MKQLYFLSLFLLPMSLLVGQNIRWELSTQAFSTFNAFSTAREPSAPQVQHVGLRLGAALNKFSDIQLGFRYQSRRDFVETSLLTPTRRPPRRQLCPPQGHLLASSGYEGELLFRIRNHQFSRVHMFWGAGLAWLYAPDIHDYDQQIQEVEISGRNGNTRIIECGIREGHYEGVSLSMIFSPGVRIRWTHKIHSELETQVRYNPIHQAAKPMLGLGFSMVYNFY
ncbi:MAG: hypothetical protein AAF587_36495 [Bacteroidota bacterium]